MQIKARAKINLALDVLGPRPDGYHELATVMQTLALHDVVELGSGSELTLHVEGAALPNGLKNLALQAAHLLRRQSGYRGGATIRLRKNIPVAAGLAGGSADAAAVLLGLNKFWALGLGPAELATLGAELGSDVPFCLQGGTALARGRGELITPLPDLPSLGVVLVKPSFGVSTREVFQRYDTLAGSDPQGCPGMLAAVRQGDPGAVSKGLANALEPVTISMHPVVGRIKQELLAAGAAGALMCGSGPTVFGLFPDEARARLGAAKLRAGDFTVLVTKFAPVEDKRPPGVR